MSWPTSTCTPSGRTATSTTSPWSASRSRSPVWIRSRSIAAPTKPRAVVTVVGRGVTATGVDGEAGGHTDGKLRRATNVVSAVNDQFLEVVFERPGEDGVTDLEGVGAAGDSGSPAFLDVDGTPDLAGLNSWGDGDRGTGIGQYGALDYQTRVSRFGGVVGRGHRVACRVRTRGRRPRRCGLVDGPNGSHPRPVARDWRRDRRTVATDASTWLVIVAAARASARRRLLGAES